MGNEFYITIDGDSIGARVGRAVLADDEAGLVQMSNIINGAQQFMAEQLQKMGGRIIELGGDELTAKIPETAVPQIEAMRHAVQKQFGFTITCGIGSKLSEAAKSLIVGKTNGKDQIVMYSPDVDQQLAAVSEHVASGQGSEEESKISEAYLQGSPMENSQDVHDHQGDDCPYCQEMNAEQAPIGDETNPDELGTPLPPIEGEMPIEGDEHEHSEDDCPYCQDETQEQLPPEGQDPGSNEMPPDDMPGADIPATDDQVGVAPAPQDANLDEHTEEGMRQIAAEIENEEGGPTQSAEGAIDGDQLPDGDMVGDGVSRPADYDDTDSGEHTMGLSEEDEGGSPDLGSVLQDGLDSHSDNIQKEKVSQMVGEALTGFKSQKKVLEMAKEQAPEFYMASISMLRAMIEMAKMLGFSGDEQVPTQEAAPQEPASNGIPAAPAEGEQPPPKIPGQSAKV